MQGFFPPTVAGVRTIPPATSLSYLRQRRGLLLAAIGLWIGGGYQRSVQALNWDPSQMRAVMQNRFGPAGLQALDDWLKLLQNLGGQGFAAQSKAINAFWNRALLASDDKVLWSQADYWATPIESLGRRAGDCEDYAIGKYFSLVYLGVPPQEMRFVYVRARVGGMGSTQSIAHMVLSHYTQPDADPLVMDNLVDGMALASQRKDLTPVFSFNAQGVYVTGAQPTPVERINRWQDLLTRMRAQGMSP